MDFPIVANREVDTVRVSLRTELRSPPLDSATDAPGSFPRLGFDRDGSAVKLGSVTPKGFVSERYQAVGLSAPFAGGEVTGVVGTGIAPLGVSSPLASAEADSFFEVGVERHLLDFGNHSLSLIGSYGESHDGMDSSAARLGLRHEWKQDRASFSLYAGALRAGGSIGIPGHAEVSRPRVSVREDSPEVRAPSSDPSRTFSLPVTRVQVPRPPSTSGVLQEEEKVPRVVIEDWPLPERSPSTRSCPRSPPIGTPSKSSAWRNGP